MFMFSDFLDFYGSTTDKLYCHSSIVNVRVTATDCLFSLSRYVYKFLLYENTFIVKALKTKQKVCRIPEI